MINKKFTKYCLVVLVLAIIILPIFSFAQAPGTSTKNKTIQSECGTSVKDLGNVICRIGFLLNKIIPILITLGVIYFVWGVITYMIGADEEQKTKGKNKIIYGIIGLVVIGGIWGLVNIVIKTFDLGSQDIPGISSNIENLTEVTVQGGSSACALANEPTLGDLINYVTCLIGKSVIPLIFILAIASFVWGVVQYVINAESEEKRSKGRDFMIWGIIALTVMVSVWGLVNILGNTFNVDMKFVPQLQ